jgi:hypothetical protein
MQPFKAKWTIEFNTSFPIFFTLISDFPNNLTNLQHEEKETPRLIKFHFISIIYILYSYLYTELRIKREGGWYHRERREN